ncbi:MAG TPA: MotA/TolQ/ExbB proton channel family protein [Kofleriaceae bacterium]|jgi:biopolymer transport protein ExbB|nr:MotA/TolQ/ExbB proton channel family protein [Kofleriaceae bacterium]
MDLSIYELMSHGGGAMWVVMAFSVIALAVGIERAIAQFKFVTRARALGDTVTRCLARGAIEESRSACERSPSPIADVFLVGYERMGRAKPEHVVTAVHRERQRVNQALRTRLWMLGTIGATAPFVGLFGTVIGIITGLGSFQKGQQVSFSDVAGPVSQALIVTAAGILVAVEAVVLFNFFSQRASRIATEMRLLTDEFLELLLDAPEDSEPRRNKKVDKDVEADVRAEKAAAQRKKDDDGREAA